MVNVYRSAIYALGPNEPLSVCHHKGEGGVSISAFGDDCVTLRLEPCTLHIAAVEELLAALRAKRDAKEAA